MSENKNILKAIVTSLIVTSSLSGLVGEVAIAQASEVTSGTANVHGSFVPIRAHSILDAGRHIDIE
jgi:hypothetical protein